MLSWLKRHSPSEWYTMVTAVVLLGLVLLDNHWVTLIASAIGVVAGLMRVARGPLQRSGIFAFVGFVIAGALAIFNLLR